MLNSSDEAVGKLLANYLTKSNQTNKVPILDEEGIFTGNYFDKRISQGPDNQPDPDRLTIHLDYMTQKYGKNYQLQKGMPIAGGFDPVDTYESEGFGESVGNVTMASINESFAGVAYKGLQTLFSDATPDDFFDMSHWSPSDKEEFMVGVGSLIADAPVFAVGGGIGAFAGKKLIQQGIKQMIKSGAKTGSKKLLGQAVGRIMMQVPGSVGAFAGHTAAKEGVRASYEPTSIEDYITQVAKSGVTGAVMGGVGGALGGPTTKALTKRIKQSGKSGRSVAKTKVQAAIRKNRKRLDKGLAFSGEVGVFTVIDPAMEGRLPTVQDFSHALGTIVSLKIAHKIPGMAKKAHKKFLEYRKNNKKGISDDDLSKKAALDVVEKTTGERLTGQIGNVKNAEKVSKQQKTVVEQLQAGELGDIPGTKGFSEKKSADYEIPKTKSVETSDQLTSKKYSELEDLKGKSVKQIENAYRKLGMRLKDEGKIEESTDVFLAIDKLELKDITGKDTNKGTVKKMNQQFYKAIPIDATDLKIRNRFVGKLNRWANKMIEDPKLANLLKRAEDFYTTSLQEQGLFYDNGKWFSKQNRRAIKEPQVPPTFWRKFQKEFDNIAGKNAYPVKNKNYGKRDFGSASKNFAALSSEVTKRIKDFSKHVSDGVVTPLSKLITKVKLPKNIAQIERLEKEIQKLDSESASKIVFLRALIEPIKTEFKTVSKKQGLNIGEVPPSVVSDIISSISDGSYSLTTRRGALSYTSDKTFKKVITLKDGSKLTINRPTISFNKESVHLKFTTAEGKQFDGFYKLSDGTAIRKKGSFAFSTYMSDLIALKKKIEKNQPKSKLVEAKAVEEANKRDPISVIKYTDLKNTAAREVLDLMIPLGTPTPTKIHLIAPDLKPGDKKPAEKVRKSKTEFDIEREMIYGESRSGYILAEIPTKSGKNIMMLLDIYTPTDFSHVRKTTDPFYHITLTNLIHMSNYGNKIDKKHQTELDIPYHESYSKNIRGNEFGNKYWSPSLIGTPMFNFAKRMGFGSEKVGKNFKVTKLDDAGVSWLEKAYRDLSTVGFIKQIEKAMADFSLSDPIKYIKDVQRKFYEDILLRSEDSKRTEEIVKDLGPVFTRDQIELRYQENETGIEGSKQTPAGRLSSIKRIERGESAKRKLEVEKFVESLTEREGKQYLKFLKEELVKDQEYLTDQLNSYNISKEHFEAQLKQGKTPGFSIREGTPDGSLGFSAKKFQFIWDKLNPTVRAVIYKDKTTGKEEVIAPITLATKLLSDLKITLTDYFKLPDVEAEYTGDSKFLNADINTATFDAKTLGSPSHTAHEVFHHIGIHLERAGFKLGNYDKELRSEAYPGETHENYNNSKQRMREELFARFGDRFVTQNSMAKSNAPKLYKDVVLMLKKMADGKGYDAVKEYMDGLVKYDSVVEKDIRTAIKTKMLDRRIDESQKGMSKFLSHQYSKWSNKYHGLSHLMQFLGVDTKGRENTEQYALAVEGTDKIQTDAVVWRTPFLLNRDLTTTSQPHLKNMSNIFRELGTTKNSEDFIMYNTVLTADKYLNKTKMVDGKKVADPRNVGLTQREINAFKRYIETEIAPTDRAKIEQAAKDFNALMNLAVDQLVLSGMVKLENADYVKKYNPYYMTMIQKLVPEIRDSFSTGESQQTPFGTSVYKQPIKRFLDRAGQVENPLQSTINMMHTMYSASTKHMVTRNLFEALEGYRSDFAKTEGLGKYLEPIEGVALERELTGKLKLDLEEINKLFGEKGIKLESETGANIAKEDFIMMTVMAQNIKPSESNILTFRDDSGKVRYYRAAGEIMDAFLTYTNMDRGSFINNIIKVAKKPTEIVRMFAVTYNPQFMMKNIPRDILTAMVQTRTNLTLGEIIKGYKDAFRLILSKDNMPKDAIERQFIDSGIVESNFNAFAERSKRGKEAEVLMNQKAISGLQKITEYMRKFGTATELGPRLAEFRKSIAQGKSMTESRVNARDITVNFLRSGQYGAVANQLIPFFNPAIQGFDKMIRTGMSKDFLKVGLIRAATSILAPTVALWLLNREEDWYKDLSPNEKALWWHFKLPGMEDIIRIPKPYDFGMVFGGMPESMLNFMDGGDFDSFKDGIGKAVERTVPLPTSLAGTLASAAIAKPFLQWENNINYYWDQPVVDYFTARKPNELQFYDSTPNLYRAAGAAFNLSPIKLKQFASDVTAGQSDLVAKGIDWINPFLDEKSRNNLIYYKQQKANQKYYSLFYKIMPFLKAEVPKDTLNKRKEFVEKTAISKIKALLKAGLIDRFEYRQREREIKLKNRRKR